MFGQSTWLEYEKLSFLETNEQLDGDVEKDDPGDAKEHAPLFIDSFEMLDSIADSRFTGWLSKKLLNAHLDKKNSCQHICLYS